MRLDVDFDLILPDELEDSLETHFVIVTATEIEKNTVIQFLKPLHGKEKPCEIPYNEKTYYWGMLGHYNCVLLKCEMGSTGRDGATLAINDAILRWNPNAVIMVGIAFGKDKNRQRMGDVLISTQVIPHNIKRVGENNTIYRGPHPEAGQILLDRAKNLQWNWKPRKNSQCRKAAFGAILSGEELIDNYMFRDTLFKEFPYAIGGEMEGWGLYSAAERNRVEWIVVKAICDFGADKKKNYQKLAAKNAVDFVIALLNKRGVAPNKPRRKISGETNRKLLFKSEENNTQQSHIKSQENNKDNSLSQPDISRESLKEEIVDDPAKLKNINIEKNKVFLSYANENERVVSGIYNGLTKRRVNVWFDKVNLRPGNWKIQIQKAISQSRYFVICISNAALKKTGDKPGFQDEELNFAYNIAMAQSESSFSIVPVRIEDCDRGDFRLSSFQQFDLFHDFEIGLDKLATAIGGSALSNKMVIDDKTREQEMLATLIGKAEIALYAGDFDKASVLMTAAANIKPDFYEAWYNSGVALLHSGKFTEAIKSFDKSLEIKPDYFSALVNKGTSLVQIGHFNEALHSYDRAIQINPHDDGVWENRGNVLFSMANYEDALISYNKTLELRPNDFRIWKIVGTILCQFKRYDRALNAYDKALEIKPDYTEAMIDKGTALYYSGNYQDAILVFKNVIDNNPCDYMAWTGLGYVFEGKGLIKKALEACDRALKLKPDYHSALTLRERINIHSEQESNQENRSSQSLKKQFYDLLNKRFIGDYINISENEKVFILVVDDDDDILMQSLRDCNFPPGFRLSVKLPISGELDNILILPDTYQDPDFPSLPLKPYQNEIFSIFKNLASCDKNVEKAKSTKMFISNNNESDEALSIMSEDMKILYDIKEKNTYKDFDEAYQKAGEGISNFSSVNFVYLNIEYLHHLTGSQSLTDGTFRKLSCYKKICLNELEDRKKERSTFVAWLECYLSIGQWRREKKNIKYSFTNKGLIQTSEDIVEKKYSKHFAIYVDDTFVGILQPNKIYFSPGFTDLLREELDIPLNLPVKVLARFLYRHEKYDFYTLIPIAIYE